jgi:hypothetical protein
MTKKEYHIVKNYIKSLCIDSVYELANNVGLNEYETKLIVFVNKTESRVAISLKLGASESKISKDLRKIFTKINDYLKRQE